MGDWYRVVKTIKGHRYIYEQRTWREGNRVRTESRYIGPAGGGDGRGAPGDPALTLQGEAGGSGGDEEVEIDLAAAMRVVEASPAQGWRHHWEAGRRGRSLVLKNQMAERVMKALAVEWRHEPTGAFYSPAIDQVNIPPLRCFVDTEHQTASQAYYMVLFHEVVHWTGNRVARDRGSMFVLPDYAREELVAELGAIMLMQQFGMVPGGSGRHALYFQTWRDRIPEAYRAKAVERAKVEAQKTVRYIMRQVINTTQDRKGVV